MGMKKKFFSFTLRGKRKKIVLTVLSFFVLSCFAAGYYLNKKINDPEYLGDYFREKLGKIIKTPIKANIDVSLMNNTVVIDDCEVVDPEGLPLLSIPKVVIRFEKLVLGVKIRSVEIRNPKLSLRSLRDGKLNCLVFHERPTPLPVGEKEDLFKEIKAIFHEKSTFKIENGSVSWHAPKILKKKLEIYDIFFEVLREPTGKFPIGKKEKYTIGLKLGTHFTDEIALSGSYDALHGLSLTGGKPVNIATDLLTKDILLPERIKIEGKTTLDEIMVQGFSQEIPSLHWQFRVNHGRGALLLEDRGLRLNDFHSGFDVRDGKLCGIEAKASFHGGNVLVENGRITPDGKIYLPFKIRSLPLGKGLYESAARLCSFSPKDYWEQFSPKGKLEADGTLFHSAQDCWSWDLSLTLSEASIHYRGVEANRIFLALEFTPKAAEIRKFEWCIRDTLFRIETDREIPIKLPLELPRTTLSFKNFYIDRSLYLPFPMGEKVWNFIKAEGFVDAKIVMEGNPLKNLPSAEVFCYKMKAQFAEVPYPSEVLSAHLSFHDRCLDLKEIRAKSAVCDAPIYVSGKVWPLDRTKKEVPLDVYFQIENAVLDQTAYDTFTHEPDPKAWQRDIQSIWDHLRVNTGLLTVRGHVKRDIGVAESPGFQVEVEGKNCDARYIDFVYPVDHVCGTVKAFREEKTRKTTVTFSKIKAKNREGELEVSGEIVAESQRIAVHGLTVKGKNIAISNDLKEALGEKYGKIWDELSPQGNMDIEVRVDKKDTQKTIDWKAQVELNGIRASYRRFPYEVEGIRGKLDLSADHFLLHGIHSHSGERKIELKGEVKEENLFLDVAASRLPLDERLFHALPPEGKEVWKRFDSRGSIDARIRLNKKRGEAVDWKAVVDLGGVCGAYRDFPYFLEKVQGKLYLSSDFFRFKCTGKSREMISDFEGKSEKGALHFTISAQNLSLDRTLYDALPDKLKAIWDQFEPSGKTDMVARFQEGSEAFLCLLPTDCSIRYRKFPYPVNLRTKVHGPGSGIHISDGHFEFRDIHAKHGISSFDLAGSFYETNVGNRANSRRVETKPGETENGRVFKMEIQGRQVAIDPSFRSALSLYFPEMAETFSPDGKAEKAEVKFEIYQGANEYLTYTAKIDGLSVSMKKESFLEKLACDVEMQGYAYDGKYHATGKIQQGNIVLKGMQIDNLQSDVKFFDDYLVFHPVRGSFYKGNLRGNMIFDTSLYGAYKGNLSVNDAQLNHLSSLFAQGQESSTSGLLSGRIVFQGSRHSKESVTGKGRIHIRNGAIWEFPVFLALFDLFSLPSKPAFRDGDIRFSISKGAFDLSAIQFYSSILSISGRGTIGFDGQLNLMLLTHFSLDFLPRIPFVDKVWDDLRKDLFAIDVKGNLQKPSISLKQWRDLRNLFDFKKKESGDIK